MRNVWLTSTAAVLMGMGAAGTMALGAAPWGGNSATLAPRAASAPPATMTADPALPSSQIAPLEHPFKYFAAAMSELPIGATLSIPSKATDTAAGKSAPRADSIALQTPTGPPSPRLYISIAQMAERQDNIAEARRQYKQALAMWPGNVDVLRAAARMEDRQGHLAWAEYLYKRAAASNPHHAGALNDLGLCLARQGKLEQSVQTIEQAIHLQPDKALYRNNVATVLVELRQDQKALAHLAAVHSPAEASYNMGQLLVQRGRGDEAEPYFVAAVEQDPQLQQAQAALAGLRGEPAAEQPLAVAEPETSPVPATVEDGPQLAPQPVNQPQTQAAAPAYPAYLPPTYQRVPSQAEAAPVQSPMAITPRHLPPVGVLPGRVSR